MTLGIRYAARSDVGMLREGNEDSAYAGAHLLAVADGMGGHVGGEIASAAAISELRKLDKDLPAPELLAALEHTVKAANENLHRIVESDPALQGMGTTLTAMLWAGNQVALVHIGDSRAYLLRDGSLFQITHDHTLVQSLVDEGRISPDEAASHPQRSLLLRALDGRGEVDPDLSLREAKVGDRYLLCSDGLSGVVTAETIFQVLTDVDDPEQAVRQLIDLANRGGGPDNITCVVADVVELSQQSPPGPGTAVGAAATARSPEPAGGPGAMGVAPQADTPASRAAQLRDTRPQPPVAVDEMPPQPAAAAPPMPMHDPRSSPPPGGAMAQPMPRRSGGMRKWAWLIGAAGLVIVGVVAVGVVVVQNLRSGYYVAEQAGQVVLYKGSPEDMPVISLHDKAPQKEQPNPPIAVADLPVTQQQAVRETFRVDGLADLESRLRGQVCRHILVNEGGKVTVWRGRGQQNCQPVRVKDSGIPVNELPNSDRAAIQDNKKAFQGQRLADIELTKLNDRRNQCKQNRPTIPDCPSGGGRS